MSRKHDPTRRNDLVKIHVAKKDRGLDDDEYRTLLRDVTGKDSAADLTWQERARVLDRFMDLGWKPKPNKRTKPKGLVHVPDSTPHAQQKRYLLALARKLGWSLGGLDTRCRRQFGVDKFLWLQDQGHLQTLGRDMVKRCRERGLDTDPAGSR